MASLPNAGRIRCDRCFGGSTPSFDVTKRTEGAWRISANPLAWGNSNPEVVVLGFSKGPTQAGALQSLPHDEIAFKGSRLNVGKILSHVCLIPRDPPEGLKAYVDRQIADTRGRFHFGSLIRCTVERFESSTGAWKGSGGGMLDRFVATSFGDMVARNCTGTYLAALPATTRLVVMFGLGTNLGYVEAAREMFQKARPGDWRRLNRVAYGDGVIVVVHVEHFASQGRLIPAWLGELGDHRAELGILAREAVFSSGIKLANVPSETSRGRAA